MSAQEKAVYHGWVVLSMLMIVGALGIATPLMILFDYDPGRGYLVIASGALVGGFIAGRSSPHKRINEPAVAAVMVILLGIAALTTTGFGDALWDRPSDVVLERTLILAGIALVAATAGAFIGGATRNGPPSAHPVWWAVVSMLVTAGAMGSSVFLTFIVFGEQLAGGGTAVVLVGFFVSALGSGYVTQWAAPERVPLAVCAGVFTLFFAGGALATFLDHMGDNGIRFEVIGGTAVCGVVLASISYAGAGLAIERREEKREVPAVPPAKATRNT
jgi:hypothetical protein